MKKLLRIVLAGLAVVVLVAAGLAWFVLYTEGGARRVLALAHDASGGALSYATVSGSLSGGFELSGLHFEADRVAIGVSRISASLDVDVIPLRVTVPEAVLADVDIELRQSSDDAQGAPIDFEALLEGLALPFELVLPDVSAAPVIVRQESSALLDVASASLGLRWHKRLELGDLRLNAPDLELGLTAALDLETPFAVSAVASARAGPGLTNLPEPLELEGGIDGDFDSLLVLLEERRFGVTVNADVGGLLGSAPRFNLELVAPGFEFAAAQTVAIEDVVLAGHGWLDGFAFESRLSLTSPEAMAVQVAGTGSLERIDLESLVLEHAAGSLRAAGSLDFTPVFDGSLRLENTRPDVLIDAWPSGVPVTGSARIVASPDAVSIFDGEVAAGDSRGRFEGTVDTRSNVLDARIEWQDLRWPMTGDASLGSRKGSALLNGALDAWTAEVNLFLAAPGVPEGQFGIAADGRRTRANVAIVEGNVLGGKIDGTASVDWGDAPTWQARLGVDSIVTGTLMSAFPGSVSADLDAGSIDGLRSARVEIKRLEGIVLDEALSGGGSIEVSPERLVADTFRIAHGATLLEVDGDVASSAGVRFDIRSERLADYSPLISGDLHARGTLSATADRTTLNLTASSTSLLIGDAVAMDLSIDVESIDDAGHRVAVRSASASVGGRSVDNLELDALLEPDTQRLSLRVEPVNYRLEFELDGALDDWSAPLDSSWRGRMSRFVLEAPGGTTGELEAPAVVVLSASALELSDFCVSGERTTGLCAGVSWTRGGELGVTADADSLPLDVVNVLVQTGFDFSQFVSGSVRWRQREGEGPTGTVNIQLSPGTVTSDAFPSLDLATDVGELAFEVEDGQLLEGQLDLPLPGTGFINGHFLVDDIGLGTASPIEGTLDARIDDIDVLAVFLPDVDDAAGEITADLSVDGTLAEPLFGGRAALKNGTLNYFPLGLVLTDIDVTGAMNERQGVDLEGSFRAGEGVATIRTSRESGEDRQGGIHFAISGDDLSVINLPDVTARADADLELDLKGSRLDINGRIDIPFARIRPRNLATAPIGESSDVVIVAGELPGEEIEEDNGPDLEVFGSMTLGVGPDVEVDVDVASANVSGSADFEWSGDVVPYGDGRYDLVGSVEAFGQVLDISEGGVRFPNAPADNPNIRVRATREIFGNSQIKRAGILVSGSARRPTIEAYTEPRTTEERALALLITGNDFDFEKGVGAIDFGTYIAPRLFLSYGVGVFTRENIVSARYDLTTGWGVRVSSGAKESGVDMTYRIER